MDLRKRQKLLETVAASEDASLSERLRALELLAPVSAGGSFSEHVGAMETAQLDAELDGWVRDVVLAVATGASVLGIDPSHFPHVRAAVEEVRAEARAARPRRASCRNT
jgi:hypothetical protein